MPVDSTFIPTRPATLAAVALAAAALFAAPVSAQEAPPAPEAPASRPSRAPQQPPRAARAGTPAPPQEPAPAPTPTPGVPQTLGPLGPTPAVAPLPPGRRFSLADEKDPARRAYFEGRNFAADSEWEKAIAKFAEVLAKYPKDRIVDETLFYQAFALKKLGKYEESWRSLERLSAEFPKSRWLRDARVLQIEIAPLVGRQGFVDAETRRQQDVELKIVALQSLANSSPERALTMIEGILKSGSTAEPELQRGALMVLGQIGGPRVRPIALELARTSQDAELRRAAIWALGAALEQGDTFDQATFDALRDLARTSADGDVARHALFAISQGDDPRVCQFLVETASSAQNAEVRRTAILMLGDKGDCAPVDQLERIFNSAGDEETRRIALLALSNSGDPKALDVLLRVARGSADTDVRRFALLQLAERDPGRAVQLMAEWYDSERNETLKEQLIDALGMTEDRRALEKLLQIGRSDPSPQMRRKAVFWIGQSDDPEALKFLEEILRK